MIALGAVACTKRRAQTKRAAVPVARGEVAQIALGKDQSCARTAKGRVLCWGDAARTSTIVVEAQLPKPTRTTPAPVGLDGASTIAVSAKHGCAVVAGGKVRCFVEQEGKLALYDVEDLDDAVELSAYKGGTCARRRSGTVACFARLGNVLGDTKTHEIPELGGVVGVAAGDLHACALRDTGTVECWGSNATSQLGEGATGTTGTPRIVPGVDGARGLAAGSAHTCAIARNGVVHCWGDNGHGQLGAPEPATTSAKALAVAAVTDAVQVAAGARHTCARTRHGHVWCWGDNGHGQLGDGTTSSRSTPVRVAGLDQVADVAVGESHTCALRANGEIHCWGGNARGQLGDGTTNDSPRPVRVAREPFAAP